MTNPDKKLGAMFRLALRAGAVDAVIHHLSRGESLDGRDAAGLTPLMIAAIHNHHACCERLVSLGANSRLRSIGGRTAAELAVDHGHMTIASMLAPCAVGGGLLADGAREFVATASEDTASPAPNDTLAAGTSDATSDASSKGASETGLACSTSPEVEDMNGWAADISGQAPAHETWIAEAAREIHRRISTHRRIDDASDWSAVEFDLPDARIVRATFSHDDLPAIARLISSGLDAGYVSEDQLHDALDTDCGANFDRAREITQRILNDLGILTVRENTNVTDMVSLSFSDVAAEALDLLLDQLERPPESLHVYLAEAHKLDLIRREDEERIGRQIDGALGALVRTLAALGEADWLRYFLRNAKAETLAANTDGENEGEDVAEGDDVGEPEGGNTARLDFRSHVQSLRNGADELGRDAPVPRPAAAERTELLALAIHLDYAAAASVTTSIAVYESALNRLVKANLRLAVSLSHNYRYSGIPLDDLVQEANIGLMRAAERFDFRLGYKFSTYATWWIRQGISRSVQDTSRTMRVPVHMGERINAIHRARRALEFGCEGEVNIEDIARRLSLPISQVLQALRFDTRVVSLEECGPGREPFTPDPGCIVDPDGDAARTSCDRSLSAAISRMFEEIGKRSSEVLIARFGFDGCGGKTLEEVGQQFGVTRERIRQIEAKALGRMRSPFRIEVLEPYAPVLERFSRQAEP